MDVEEEIIKLTNELLQHTGRGNRVSLLGQCNCDLLYSLYYNALCSDEVPIRPIGRLCTVPIRPIDEADSYQLIINGLSELLPAEISLAHITGANIANGDLLSLCNLLQILREVVNINCAGAEQLVESGNSATNTTSLHTNTSSSLCTDDTQALLQAAAISQRAASLHTNTSSSLCTDDTQALLQAAAISQRVAIAKRELSSSSGSGKYSSHDILKTPSPRRHSSSFTPLLMSTPHVAAMSRLGGVDSNGGVAGELESISSISNEVSTEMIPSLTITTMSSELPIDTTASHDTDISHDTVTLATTNTINGHTDMKSAHNEIDTSPILQSHDAMLSGSHDAAIPDASGSHDTTLLDTSGSHDTTLLDTSGSHDTEAESDGDEESSHDPNRAVILDKIYMKFIRDKESADLCQKAHKLRKKQHADQPLPPRDDLLGVAKGEFPFLQLSPSMARRLWQKQLQQVKQLSRPLTNINPSKQVKEAEKRQAALLRLIRKELTHQQWMEEKCRRQMEQRMVKANLHAHKMASARTKRYYWDYEKRLRAKMQRKRTREEQVFRRALEEGLELQRNRIREMQQFSKEKRREEDKKHVEQLESLENYYRDQFVLLAEEVAQEKFEKETRRCAQQQLVERMRRELRQKMEQEVKSLQECIDREDDDVHFRQLDADHFLSNKLQRLKLTTLTNT